MKLTVFYRTEFDFVFGIEFKCVHILVSVCQGEMYSAFGLLTTLKTILHNASARQGEDNGEIVMAFMHLTIYVSRNVSGAGNMFLPSPCFLSFLAHCPGSWFPSTQPLLTALGC